MQNQVTASALLTWINKQLHNKKLSANNISDMKGGNLFLQILHVNYPKIVNLTKIYIKPKANYEIMQNFKYLAYIFRELKWKKLEVEKYAGASITNNIQNRDRELLALTKYIYKNLTENTLISQTSIKKKPSIQSIESPQSNLEINLNGITIAEYSSPNNEGENVKQQINKLEKTKKSLLTKLMSLEHIVKNTDDPLQAKKLILKVLDTL